MSSEQNNQVVSLKDMIEKVITSGNITPDDQRGINECALTRALGDEDKIAIETLTEMIKQGRIAVS